MIPYPIAPSNRGGNRFARSAGPSLFRIFAGFCLMAVAVGLAILVRVPMGTWLALVALYAAAFIEPWRRPAPRLGLGFAWVASLTAWGSFVLCAGTVAALDLYFVLLVTLVAAAIAVTTWQQSAELRAGWNRLSLAWGVAAATIWTATAYTRNLQGEFLASLAVCAGLVIAAKRWGRLPFLMVQVANTLLLFLVGLPLADLALRLQDHRGPPGATSGRYYSYEFAKENPAAFARWWNGFLEEWSALRKRITRPDPTGAKPFVLRPNSEGKMFESQVRINNLGFRGPDISVEKGNAYRIVALGESTTFGHTIAASDVPWPEVLQQLIRERLSPERPVQVINAGIPSYTLRWNLERLEREILPLRPDLIISYHGYNGFMWLQPALPPTHGPGPPPYRERPLKLLADCEYRLKVLHYRRARSTAVRPGPQVPSDPMATEYARAYEDLIQIARTNHLRLVLANYAMAVNSGSDPDVIAFYRAAFPHVLSQIRANQTHSQIVGELVRRHPEVLAVDTHPGLDGQHDQFIDLVHFTGAGERRFADTLFRAMLPALKQDLQAAKVSADP